MGSRLEVLWDGSKASQNQLISEALYAVGGSDLGPDHLFVLWKFRGIPGWFIPLAGRSEGNVLYRRRSGWKRLELRKLLEGYMAIQLTGA
eukprot:12512813-Prorocentrum_lima.AAC.1